MNTQREALLAEVWANPDDDAPRLTYADWLEREGDADHAAFIRLEIERDRLPHDAPRRKELDARIRPLKRRCMAVPGVHIGLTNRGFFSDVQVVGLFALRDSLEALGPRSVRLSVLVARQEPDQTPEEDAAFREIFASPWVRHWSLLEMQMVRVTADQVRAMSGPGNLTGLELLCIRDGADDGAIRALGEVQWPRLACLAIHEVWRRPPLGYAEAWAPLLLTPAAVHALADSPLLSRLEYLSLWGDWLGDDELLALARSPRVAGLKFLYPWPRRDSWAGLRGLLESPHLAGLTHLNLSRIKLAPDLAALLARPEVLPGLTYLDISFEEPAEHRTVLAGRFGDRLREGPGEDSQG
jgi:uncharacterized protein (TIGR02996 family)